MQKKLQVSCSSILFFDLLHRNSKDIFFSAHFNYAAGAREAKRYYEQLRATASLWIAKRHYPESKEEFFSIYSGGELGIHFIESPRIQSSLFQVVFAIRDYHYRNGEYSSSLSELQLGAAVIDPFTGDELIYKTGPQGFVVYAGGPTETMTAGKSLFGQGMTVTWE